MILMPGGRAGRQTASFPPAGDFIEGDPVGTAGEVQGVDADAGEAGLPGTGRGRAQPHRLAAAATARPVPAALLRRLRDPGGRHAAAAAGGHHQGGPVRGAGAAEDVAGAARCLTVTTTSTPG